MSRAKSIKRSIKGKGKGNKERKGKRISKNQTQKRNLSDKRNPKIVVHFLEMLNMIKLYHWKTRSYSQHKATDELYGKLNENIDRFVEVLLGKDQSRLSMLEKKMNLLDSSKTSSSQSVFLDRILEYRKFLIGLDRYFDESEDSDLMNIRDEILADLNQFLYLMSFDKI